MPSLLQHVSIVTLESLNIINSHSEMLTIFQPKPDLTNLTVKKTFVLDHLYEEETGDRKGHNNAFPHSQLAILF